MEEPIRVVVVEDMPLLREDYCDIISGAEDLELVGQAASAADCRRLLEAGLDCDLLLLDVEMETTDAGLVLARELAAQRPDLHIVFLSAHAADEIILAGMDSGALDYVVKGCPDEELLDHIRRAAQGEPLMQPQVQQTMRQAYERLRKSERSLLFFIHNVSTLTPAEKDLLYHLLQERKLAEIAEIRVVELSTIKTQVKGLLHKFGCSRTKEIVHLIRELGLEHLFQRN